MTVVTCPTCGKKIEAKPARDATRVVCLQCTALVTVPGTAPPRKKKTPPGDPYLGTDCLSAQEYVVYAFVFAFAPVVNVVVSSLLYLRWREEQPTKAYEINRLGWITLVAQVVLFGCCYGPKFVTDRLLP